MTILEEITHALRGSPRQDDTVNELSQTGEIAPIQEAPMETELFHETMSVDNQNNNNEDIEMAMKEDKTNPQKNNVTQPT